VRTCAALWPCLLLAVAGTVQASDAVWTIRGDTTSRLDRYQHSGDIRLSPHLHTGTHAYQDFNVQVSGRPRDDQYWELNLSGVASGSDYRTRGDGFTPEWLHLRHENSAGPVRFRLDLGDQRAHFSRLTLDRTLQAGRIELQPAASDRRQQSLVLLSGRDRSDWRQSVGTDDTYHGASWLIEDQRLGRYSVNVVQTHGDGAAAQSPEDTQLVASLAGAWEFGAFRQQLAAEAERAWQHQQRGEDPSDVGQGLRLSLAGSDRYLPFNYSLQFERFDDAFEPAGVDRGVLARRLGDSRRLGGSGGWRFGRIMELRGQFDRTVDEASTRELTVEDLSFRLLSPTTFGLLPGLGHEWAVSFRDRENAPRTIDTRSTEARWDIRIAGRESSATQVQLRWYEQDDHASGFFALEERQMLLEHSRRLHLGGLELTATPGLDYRHRTGHGEVTLLSPTFNLDFSAQAHRLGLALGYRDFDRPDEAMDLEEYSFKLDYRYQANMHTFGVEYDHILREPERGEALEAWRAGVFWRYRFQHAL